MWTYILAGLAGLAMLCAITYKVDSYLGEVKESGRVEVQNQWRYASAQRKDRELKQGAAAAKGFEKDKASIASNAKERKIYVDREVEKIVYRNICFPDSGLCLANSALRGDRGKSADTCKPDGGMPAVNGSR